MKFLCIISLILGATYRCSGFTNSRCALLDWVVGMSVIPELKHLGTIYLHPHILVKVTPIWILVSASDLKWPYWIIRGLQLDWKETWCFIIWSSRPIVERNEQGDYSTNIASASFANTVFVKIPVWTMDRCDRQKSPPYHMIWKIKDISTLSFV